MDSELGRLQHDYRYRKIFEDSLGNQKFQSENMFRLFGGKSLVGRSTTMQNDFT